MHQLRLLLRGLRWRRGLTLAVLAVATVTTTAAALGPLYARAAAESLLQDRLIQAGTGTGLRLAADVNVDSPSAMAALRRRVRAVGHVHGYNRTVEGFYTADGVTLYVPHPPLGRVSGAFLWRQNICAHVVIVAGRCPRGPNEVMASERTIGSGYFNMRVGTRVMPSSYYTGDQPVTGPIHTPDPVTIVGEYRPRRLSDPFWFGQNYFDVRTTNPDSIPKIDPFIVARSEFTSIGGDNVVEADFDRYLSPSDIRLADVAAERARVTQVLAHNDSLYTLNASTDLFSALDQASDDHRLIDTGTLLVILQLSLLAWLVLFQVVSDAIEARGNEIAMAKLRGFSPWATIRFGLGEPMALIAAAVPLGMLAALGVAHLLAVSVLAHGVPVIFTWPVAVTAVIAFAGGAVAAAVAGHRTLTRPVLDQWRRTERRPGHGRLAFVVDVVLAAAAIAGLVVLGLTHSAHDSHDTAALLAPALLVFAVAVIGVRALPLLCRRLARATRGTPRIGIFLAAAQVARRPVGLRLAALLAVAVGLATFGVAGESVATTNRIARAQSELGAAKVLTVQFAAGVDPVRATHRADPSGTWAMAATTWLPDGGDSVVGTVLAVDPSRLAAIGEPIAGGPPLRAIARAITATRIPPVTVRARAMRLHVTTSELSGDARPDVQIDLRSATQAFIPAEGPALRAGAHSYVVPVPCRDGCALRGITWDRPITATTTLSGTATITGLDVRTASGWRPIALQLQHPQAWYAGLRQGQATDRVSVTPHGVTDRFTNRNGGYGGLVYGADPSPMPAVVTPTALATDPSAPKVPAMMDETGTLATFHVVRTARLLPVVLDLGLVIDLSYLEDELPTFGVDANWQVWIGSRAPANYEARLAAVGLDVVDVQSEAGRISQLSRQAPALALLLLLVCAIAGAVLAVGGTAISISATSRRRSFELAALQAVGVARSALLRASMIEQLFLLGGAVLIGLPAGFLAARLTMPIIPEFSDPTPIPLVSEPPLTPSAAFAAAFIALMLLTAALAARALIRVAVAARLREAE